MPRLFNLCRRAQTAAVSLALGLEPLTDTRDEVVQDHVACVLVTLRRAFGLIPLRPDRSGALYPLPREVADLDGWLAGPFPAAELGRAVLRNFPAGLGAVSPLPWPQGADTGAFENSPAGRQAGHPLLEAVEKSQGRSPLWRYLGLLADLENAKDLPEPRRHPDGTAVVQAARGAYALRLRQAGGLVTGVVRITPTDHQLAPGGALSLAISRVPGDRPDLVERLVALHDPCIPVTVKQVQHA